MSWIKRSKKSQIKMMEVKTNKEYKAMLTEMEELKKAKEGLEDLLLDLMEKVESDLLLEKRKKKELEDIRTAGIKKKEGTGGRRKRGGKATDETPGPQGVLVLAPP